MFHSHRSASEWVQNLHSDFSQSQSTLCHQSPANGKPKETCTRVEVPFSGYFECHFKFHHKGKVAGKLAPRNGMNSIYIGHYLITSSVNDCATEWYNPSQNPNIYPNLNCHEAYQR